MMNSMDNNKESAMSNLMKRVGMFAINTALIETAPEAVLLIMRDVIVMQAQPVGDGSVIRYTGVSKHFRKLSFDATVPQYNCEAAKDDQGNVAILWSEASKIVAGRN